jgi:hypothetical protein
MNNFYPHEMDSLMVISNRELHVSVHTVQKGSSFMEFLFSANPHTENIINIPEPFDDLGEVRVPGLNTGQLLLNIVHINISIIRGKGGAHSNSIN